MVSIDVKSLHFASQLVEELAIADVQYRTSLIEAFSYVSRKDFIDEAFSSRQFDDISLPIGYGQTISKPSTVLRMLAHLKLKPGEKILEIGAGSGYLTAILAKLGLKVYAIEKIGPLAQLARRRLDRYGFHHILLRCADGARGWREHAPFDAMIVSAAFESVPTELLMELRPGGRLVIPLRQDLEQRLTLFQASAVDTVTKEDLGPCSFVLNA